MQKNGQQILKRHCMLYQIRGWKMSKEEAIFCMKSYLPEGSYERCPKCKYYGNCKSSEAHKMAIEALEQECYEDMTSKTGKWIAYLDEEGNDFFLCSECRIGEYHKSDRCSNCGSYMRGDEE